VDLGPGAGDAGGRLLYSGPLAGLWQADTPTGCYFSLRRRVATPEARPAPVGFLRLLGCHLRNLRDIDIAIPLGRLTTITGVSSSGKSTLVEDVLVASLSRGQPAGCREIDGRRLKPILVDQSPIGRNPRSNPATYSGLADIVRDHFATATGLSPSHFSFNRPEGACPECAGLGAIEAQMRYLPSTWLPCAACEGKRFSDEVLGARAPFDGRELTIADFFELSIEQALPFLREEGRLPEAARQAARRILEALRDVGLGYLPLGQPSPTLSGGEAQRVKLAKHLGRRSLSGDLLVLDEPTTGLHPQDVAGLLAVLGRLVCDGATVVVVEHNLDVIRAADWAIDLGPGAGPDGGRLLYAGPPAGLVDAPDSATGRALREEANLSPCPSRRDASPSRLAPRRGGEFPLPSREGGEGVGFAIRIRGARANNLKNADVDIPKRALTVVTGVSGSGKSSLVGDVLEAEARRRFLETLSLYERQGVQEGPEAPVDSVSGLGVAVSVGTERGLYHRRATVGTATEIQHHMGVLLASVGNRRCPQCGEAMRRERVWCCAGCGALAPIAEPRHFLPSTCAAACLECHGVGSLQVPQPQKLILHPEKPLCDGTMYSPGFFPQGYVCKPGNGGYDMLQALAARCGFDPERTPWQEMSPEAQLSFLFGDPQPMAVEFRGKSGHTRVGRHAFPGFYGWVRDWDTGGTYTDTVTCPKCAGRHLRPEYLAVTLAGCNAHELGEMPLEQLAGLLEEATTGAQQCARHGCGPPPLPREDPPSPALSVAGRPRLPAPEPPHCYPVGRRGAAHPPGQSARQRAYIANRAAG